MDEHQQVDDRFRTIEARVARLEAAAGAASAPGPVAPAAAQVVPAAPAAPAAPQISRDAAGSAILAAPAAAPRPSPAAAPRPSPAGAALASATPSPRPPQRSLADMVLELEERLTGRALAIVGGVALVAGAIFLLSLAFSRGWIGPEGRVLIGIAGSGIALAMGAWMLDHAQPVVGRVLVAVGLAVVSLSLFAATRLYSLIPVEPALVGSLVAALAAAFLAVRHDAEVIAVLALVAVLGAPPILGASPSLVTVAYVGTILVGFAVLSLERTWRWLPSIAFLLSAPQLASWIASGVEPAVGLVAVVAFWILFAVTAGGEEFLRPTRQLRLGSATLLVADAAFLVGAGFAVLDGPNEVLRGLFLVAVALAHVVLGGAFLLREGDRHPFGLLAAATGIAALAMAAPIQAGGPPVPIAWAAEGAALAWLASRRAHPQAGVAAAILGLLALAHILGFEYPAGAATSVSNTGPLPFLNASGLSLAFLLTAAALSAWFLRSRSIVAVIASLGVLAIAFAAPHELAGPALIAAWVGLGVGALALERFVIDRLPDDGPLPGAPLADLRFATLAAAAAVGAIALGHALAFDLPIARFGAIQPPAIPFSDDRALTLEFLVLGAAVSGWLYLRRLSWELPAVAALVVAGLILAYGSVFEVYADGAIVIAAGIAAAGLVLGRQRGVSVDGWLLATGASLAIIAVGFLAATAVIAGLGRLTMGEGRSIDHPPFVSGVSAVYGALAAALAAGARLNRRHPSAPWLGVAAGALIVFGLSVGVVDLFQARVGGPIAFEELARQAQVAMSVLWIALGAAVFVLGLTRDRLVVRQSGLGLLALASVKVFLFDLASLDVAYRVLSLMALGIFLLATAWVYARLRPPTAKPPRSSATETAAT